MPGSRTLSRRTVLGILAMALSPMMPSLALGQSQQTIRLNVPFSAGTGPDLLARILGEELRQRWNQPVIVENKPGASGNIGTQAAARAAPDGQTLLVTVNTFVMNASLYRSIPYDPETSFVPIAEIATGVLALVVHPSLNVSTFSELIALARSKPGDINYASPGRGTPQHLAMELLKLTAQINLTHVPYAGSAGAVKDVAGGHVSVMFLPIHTALPLAETGQIRILAVGSQARAQQAQVPTLAELGVTDFDVDLWYAVLAPAGTPKEIVDRYNAVFNEILAQPSVRAVLDRQGLIARGGPSERLAELIARDRLRWAKVVKDAGITSE
ncbi:tripartite tricarboxylate transporter substrate binding protein [Bradyrhizobium sp. 170]|uniref:Bug family tripartite tricarboxylate transporter substrate binding protein n=1 Tax=Bradyrhizobium sp. 170 TaxID=2782641 RepID=UPI001FFF0F71|nr:tripartite tricarboxylate transporter substrate binding protein [Bradyrhizobium sp. 170]UPK02447.1 tripartite tricarboxylate transporter substrate binding protein [Bradyrhizobium sp. 170]